MLLHPLVGLVLAYLAGAIPFAYLAGRITKGIDLREHGSGNLGATNVYRVLGWKVALIVFLLDVAKGALPAGLLPWSVDTRMLTLPAPAGVPQSNLWAILFGVAAILGHWKPVWMLFRGGGKGVATATGVFLALAPVPLLVAFATFVTVLRLSGFVSLGSITAAAVLPVALVAQHLVRGEPLTDPVLWIAILIALFVFYTHRANIARLRRGEEPKMTRHKDTEVTA